MIMLRVWGGGIYEDDESSTTCATSWACWSGRTSCSPAGSTRPTTQFQASVRAEAEAQVRRLRHHPSLVLWCGNNEDYQIADRSEPYDPA